MGLALHHVGILSTDVEKSINFYQDKFGLQLVARYYKEGEFDYAYLGDNNPATYVL